MTITDETTSESSTDAVEERRVAIEGLTAVISALEAERLALVDVGVVAGDHTIERLDPADWVAHLCGLRRSNASEQLRTAKRLRNLPALSGRFAEGGLSWDKVRSAARFAVADTDRFIAGEALEHSADTLAYLAQRARTRTPADDAERARLARVALRRDETHDGMWLRGWLPGDHGVRVAQALERDADQLGPGDDGIWAPLANRQATVLGQWAENRQIVDRDVDRTRLNLHVDARVWSGLEPGNVELDRSVLTSLTTARRIACAAEVLFQIYGEDDTILGVRRALREPPAWLRKLLLWRDQTCRHPGCGRTIRHFHHIIHWALNGETNSQNLIGLCWAHHHLVHEGGWRIEGDADGEVTFIGPNGEQRTSSPPPLRPEHRQRARRAARNAARRAARARAAGTDPPGT